MRGKPACNPFATRGLSTSGSESRLAMCSKLVGGTEDLTE